MHSRGRSQSTPVSSSALKQLDKEYELVGESLSVGRWRTFGAITVPLSLEGILENAMYLFVNAMTPSRP